MLHIFQTAINAILPIILLILVGYWLRSAGMLTDAFVKAGNKLVFRVGLCCSLFVNVYNISDLSSISWSFIAYVILITVVLFGIGYLSAVATTNVMERRGVILQGVFRSNFAIIGQPLTAALASESAVAVTSVLSSNLFNEDT